MTWRSVNLKWRGTSAQPEFIAIYAGDWAHNHRNGEGKYFYPNGDVYDGEWKNDKRHGVGTYVVAATGEKLFGQWKDGKCFGHAEIIRANHKYVGRCEDNQVRHSISWWQLCFSVCDQKHSIEQQFFRIPSIVDMCIWLYFMISFPTCGCKLNIKMHVTVFWYLSSSSITYLPCIYLC